MSSASDSDARVSDRDVQTVSESILGKRAHPRPGDNPSHLTDLISVDSLLHELGIEDTFMAMRALQRNSYTRHHVPQAGVGIHSVTITKESMKIMHPQEFEREFLRQLGTVTEILRIDCSLESHAAALVHATRTCTNLRELHITDGSLLKYEHIVPGLHEHFVSTRGVRNRSTMVGDAVHESRQWPDLRVLILRRCPGKVVNQLLQVATGKLETLIIDKPTKEPLDADIIGDFVDRRGTLRVLHLENCLNNFTGDRQHGGSIFNPRLTGISLRGSIYVSQETLMSLTTCRALTSLALPACEFLTTTTDIALDSDRQGVPTATKFVRRVIMKNKNHLEVLDVDDCRAIREWAYLTMASECKRLTEFHASRCDAVTSAVVQALLRRQSFRKLYVAGCFFVLPDAFAEFLRASPRRTLDDMSIHLCSSLTNECIQSLGSRCVSVTQMDEIGISDKKRWEALRSNNHTYELVLYARRRMEIADRFDRRRHPLHEQIQTIDAAVDQIMEEFHVGGIGTWEHFSNRLNSLLRVREAVEQEQNAMDEDNTNSQRSHRASRVDDEKRDDKSAEEVWLRRLIAEHAKNPANPDVDAMNAIVRERYPREVEDGAAPEDRADARGTAARNNGGRSSRSD